MERISSGQRENWGRENCLSPETCSVANILMVDSRAGGVIFLKSTEPEWYVRWSKNSVYLDVADI